MSNGDDLTKCFLTGIFVFGRVVFLGNIFLDASLCFCHLILLFCLKNEYLLTMRFTSFCKPGVEIVTSLTRFGFKCAVCKRHYVALLPLIPRGIWHCLSISTAVSNLLELCLIRSKCYTNVLFKRVIENKNMKILFTVYGITLCFCLQKAGEGSCIFKVSHKS